MQQLHRAGGPNRVILQPQFPRAACALQQRQQRVRASISSAGRRQVEQVEAAAAAEGACDGGQCNGGNGVACEGERAQEAQRTDHSANGSCAVLPDAAGAEVEGLCDGV